MGRAKQVHKGPGLPDATTDAQRNFIVKDGLVVGQIKEILLAGHPELDLKGLLRNSYPHRGQLVAPFSHRVPDQDVSV